MSGSSTLLRVKDKVESLLQSPLIGEIYREDLVKGRGHLPEVVHGDLRVRDLRVLLQKRFNALCLLILLVIAKRPGLIHRQHNIGFPARELRYCGSIRSVFHSSRRRCQSKRGSNNCCGQG